jgi:serine/threonine-protein kinase RsbW/stage II sporulation protein AB (anti-sigma F factor)
VSPTSVSQARRSAAEFAERAGARRTTDVELAVSEAVTNCVVHAFPEGAGGRIRLQAEVQGSRLAITVSDDGTGMRPNLNSRGLGIGIPLIGRLCDEYRVEDGPDGGAAVTMLFEREDADER